MADPIFTWRSADNTAGVSSWNVGVVDAGITSPASTATSFLIWNNHNDTGNAENTDVNDAYNIRIIATDINGNVNASDTPQVITNDWIQVKCDSMSETSVTNIGKDSANPTMPIYKLISAVGTTTNTGGTFTVATPTVGDSTSYKILGCKNDGSINAKANYAKITLNANVPAVALAGNYSFLIKCLYNHA